MLIDYQLSQTSVIVRVKIRNSSGTGVTGLTNATAGLIISTIADSEATATAYTSGGSTIGTIVTLGTYAAPTAGTCNFKQVDSTNHPGIYEIQFLNARFAVAGAKSLLISIPGSGISAVDTDVMIPLRAVNPYSASSFITGVNSLAPPSNWNLLAIDGSGRVTVGTNADKTGYSLTQAFPANFASTSIDGSGRMLLQPTQAGVTIPTVTTVTNQLTAAQIATGVWQDATAGDFTTASSIGKCLYIANAVPGAAGGHFIAGTNAATAITTSLTTTFTGNLTGSVGSVTGAVGSVTGAVGSVTGNVGGNVAGSVASVTGNVGGNVVGSVASVVGAVGSVTGSVGSVVGAVGSVTGNVGGNVVGSVGSIAGVAFPTNFGSLAIDTSGRMVLQPSGLDAVAVEAGLNARQSLSIIAAATAGVGGTGTGTYAGAGVATNRITYTASAGTRTVVTLSPPA